jgi:hypothetical protein
MTGGIDKCSDLLPAGRIGAMNNPRACFLVIVRDDGAADGTPLIVRLRAFLKRALRAYGIRCVRIEPAPVPVKGGQR